MVKNSFGGSKTKSFARKSFATDIDDSNAVRLPQNQYEKIAFVSKIYGNGICLANIIERNNPVTTPIKCHFRGKFKGKYKKNNIVSINSFILIGLRQWETTPTNSDLLFVFTQPNLLPTYFTQFLTHNNNYNYNPEHIDELSFNTTTQDIDIDIDIDTHIDNHIDNHIDTHNTQPHEHYDFSDI